MAARPRLARGRRAAPLQPRVRQRCEQRGRASFTTLALHAGYVFDFSRWSLSVSGRVDNVLDKRYAGSVIVNEGNARFFEPAPGRDYVLKLAGTYAF